MDQPSFNLKVIMNFSNRFGLAVTAILVAGLLCGWNYFSNIRGHQEDENQQVANQQQIEEDGDQVSEAPQDEEIDPQIDVLQKEFNEVVGVTKTAEELFKKMKSEQAQFAGSGQLKGEELEKAKSILREQYAFESIRERMSFQGNTTVERAEQEQGDIAASILSQRANALAQLHSDEVDEFINQPGQGFGRMRIISPYDLRPYSQWANRIDAHPVDSKLLGEPEVKLVPFAPPEENYTASFVDEYSMSDSGMPTTNLVRLFHEESARGFANRESLGLIKNLDEVAGFESHRTRLPEHWDGSIRIQNKAFFDSYAQKPNRLDVEWKINRLQLVGMLLHDEPRVYESENLPNMEELSGVDAKFRNLNDFEAASLKKLMEGEDIVTHATPNRLVMLGALRADNSCRVCHIVEEKELMGAFSYEFLRDPPVEIKVEDH